MVGQPRRSAAENHQTRPLGHEMQACGNETRQPAQPARVHRDQILMHIRVLRLSLAQTAIMLALHFVIGPCIWIGHSKWIVAVCVAAISRAGFAGST